MSSPRVLFCNCTYAQVVPAEVKAAVLRKLCESGVAFDAVADLCELSARQDSSLKSLADGGPVKIAACFPRAIKWLFASGGAPLKPEATEIVGGERVMTDEFPHAYYVHPAVVDSHLDATLLRQWARPTGKSPSGLTVAEHKTLRLLTRSRTRLPA